MAATVLGLFSRRRVPTLVVQFTILPLYRGGIAVPSRVTASAVIGEIQHNHLQDSWAEWQQCLAGQYHWPLCARQHDTTLDRDIADNPPLRNTHLVHCALLLPFLSLEVLCTVP